MSCLLRALARCTMSGSAQSQDASRTLQKAFRHSMSALVHSSVTVEISVSVRRAETSFTCRKRKTAMLLILIHSLDAVTTSSLRSPGPPARSFSFQILQYCMKGGTQRQGQAQLLQWHATWMRAGLGRRHGSWIAAGWPCGHPGHCCGALVCWQARCHSLSPRSVEIMACRDCLNRPRLMCTL